jgi:hemolysin activation/secretion protein
MKSTFLRVALLAASPGLLAQQAPSGGGLMPGFPPAQSAPRQQPQIRIEPLAAPSAPAPDTQERVLLDRLRITGSSLYSEADLAAVAGFVPQRTYSLADLQAMAVRITAHYRAAGYFAAQAVLPAQEVTQGAVTIAVNEARIGKVELRNAAGLSDSVARGPLRGLESGDVIHAGAIESRLLLLSDVPGVNVRSTLVPGASVGTSDLIVDVEPGRRVSGSIDADNAGNRYTGAARIGATLNLNNPLGLGDVASVRVLTSGSGLVYGRASYQLQAGRAQVGVAYSRLSYELGKEFESLDANGTASIASVFARYPVLRTRDNNLYVQLAYDAKTFQDRVDSVFALTDRKAGVLMASLYGDHRDSLGGGGVNSWFVTWHAGKLEIETPAALAVDAVTARTQGRYDKVSFNAMRLQQLGASRFSVLAAVQGQAASKNLDVSEKMELGGLNAVRAYPEGEAYADEGFVANVELRMDLPKFSPGMPGHMQLVGFVDGGAVTFNRRRWAPGPNRRTLSGAGVGVNWADPGNFVVRAYWAHRLGDEPAVSAPDSSSRFWVQLVKFF